MALRPRDKAVVKDFTEKKKNIGGSYLWTDGKKLETVGMGRQLIAYWKDGKVHLDPDVPMVKSHETVIRFLRKTLPRFWWFKEDKEGKLGQMLSELREGHELSEVTSAVMTSPWELVGVNADIWELDTQPESDTLDLLPNSKKFRSLKDAITAAKRMFDTRSFDVVDLDDDILVLEDDYMYSGYDELAMMFGGDAKMRRILGKRWMDQLEASMDDEDQVFGVKLQYYLRPLDQAAAEELKRMSAHQIASII